MLLFELPDVPRALSPEDHLTVKLSDAVDGLATTRYSADDWRDEYDRWYRSDPDDFELKTEFDDFTDFVDQQYEKQLRSPLVLMGYVYVRKPFYDGLGRRYQIDVGVTDQGLRVHYCIHAGFTWDVYGQKIAETDTLIYWRDRLSVVSNPGISSGSIPGITSRQAEIIHDVQRVINSGYGSYQLRDTLIRDLESAQSCFLKAVFWDNKTAQPDVERSRRYWGKFVTFTNHNDSIINTLEVVSTFPGMESLWSEVVLRKLILE